MVVLYQTYLNVLLVSFNTELISIWLPHLAAFIVFKKLISFAIHVLIVYFSISFAFFEKLNSVMCV